MIFNHRPTQYFHYIQEIRERSHDDFSSRCFIIGEHRTPFEDERRRVYPVNDSVFNGNFCSYTNVNVNYTNISYFDFNNVLTDEAKELFKNIFSIPGIMNLEFTKTHPFTRRYLDNCFCIIIDKYQNFHWNGIYNAFKFALSNQIERSHNAISNYRRSFQDGRNHFVNFRYRDLYDSHVVYLNTFFDLVKDVHKGIYDITYTIDHYHSNISSEMKYLTRKSWKIIKLLFQEIYFRDQIQLINCLRHEMQIIIYGNEDDRYDVVRNSVFLHDLQTMIAQKWNCVLSYEDY